MEQASPRELSSGMMFWMADALENLVLSSVSQAVSQHTARLSAEIVNDEALLKFWLNEFSSAMMLWMANSLENLLFSSRAPSVG